VASWRICINWQHFKSIRNLLQPVTQKRITFASNDENIVIMSKKDYCYLKTQRSEHTNYLYEALLKG